MNAQACPTADTRPCLSPLPAGVDATLARLAGPLPQAASIAAAWLRRVLSPIGDSLWPEMAWRFSRLTSSGMPMEFAWSSRETAVRWTAEVAPPESDERARLAIAAAHLPDRDRIDLAPWHRLQRDARLKYGAWLGMRHAHDTVGKLYVELPAGIALPDGHHHPLLRADGMAWRMVGLNVDGSREYYGQGTSLDRATVGRLADAVTGNGAALETLLAALTRRQELPRPSGLSLTLDAEGRALALTWFIFAKALFRDDTEAATVLGALCEGAPRAVHAALVAGRDDGAWRHGMVGAGIDVKGRTWLQCGLRPT